jgi:hypothetical protein
MENDPRVPTSSSHEGGVQERLEERLDAARELPDDYAQWLDQRRFDDQELDQ